MSETYFPLPDSQGGWVRSKSSTANLGKTEVDTAKLDETFEFLKMCTKNGGLLVLQGGKLVYERYFGKGRRDATPNLASCGKSFTSIACGILMAEHPEWFPDGLETKVYTPDYLPAEAFPLTDPRKADIRLGQLLAFTAGIRGNNPVYVNRDAQTIAPPGPDGWESNVDLIAYGKKDTVDKGACVSTATLWCDPGGGYSYATSSIHLVALMLHHLTGMELRDFIQTRLAEPMGWGAWGYGYRQNYEPGNPDRMTHTPGGGGIAVRATDMLRFGYLLLRKGEWNGKQLIPRDYVEHCSRTSPFNPHSPYSLQFDVNSAGDCPELPRDAFWKHGSGGHCLYVVPSRDLVVWKLGGRDDQYNPLNTGLTGPPAAENEEERRGWVAQVEPKPAVIQTLKMVLEAL